MLTTVFATRNRAAALPRVLDAFCGLQSPPGGWKLIIVDNGSTDDTSSVVKGYVGRLPVTLLHCAAPGKNRALNTALPEFAGDIRQHVVHFEQGEPDDRPGEQADPERGRAPRLMPRVG